MCIRDSTTVLPSNTDVFDTSTRSLDYENEPLPVDAPHPVTTDSSQSSSVITKTDESGYVPLVSSFHHLSSSIVIICSWYNIIVYCFNCI